MKFYKSVILATAFSLVMGLSVGCSDSDSSSSAPENSKVTEQGRGEAEGILAEIQGEFIELFPEMEKEEYRSIWIDEITKVKPETSKEDANAMTEMIIGMMEGDIYGAPAVEKYDFTTGNYAFNCYFIHDVKKVKMDGNRISGVDKNGKEVFNHTYSFVKEENGLSIYKSDDENSGNFTYFGFMGDTPATTFHLEFRYGATTEKMGKDGWFEGDYAYWLVGAIQADYDDKLMDSVIRLFVDENFGEEEE